MDMRTRARKHRHTMTLNEAMSLLLSCAENKRNLDAWIGSEDSEDDIKLDKAISIIRKGVK